VSLQAVSPAPVLPESMGAATSVGPQAASPSSGQSSSGQASLDQASSGSPFGTVLAEMSSEAPAPETAQSASPAQPRAPHSGSEAKQTATNSQASAANTAPAAGTSYKSVLPGATAPQFLAALLGRPVAGPQTGSTAPAEDKSAGNSNSIYMAPQPKGLPAAAAQTEVAPAALPSPAPAIPASLPASKSAAPDQANATADQPGAAPGEPNASGDVMPEPPTANSLIANTTRNSAAKNTQANQPMRGAAAPKGASGAYTVNGKGSSAAQRQHGTAVDTEFTDDSDGVARGDETGQDTETALAIPAFSPVATLTPDAASTTSSNTPAGGSSKAAPTDGQRTPMHGLLFSQTSSASESLSGLPITNREHSTLPSGSRRTSSAAEPAKPATEIPTAAVAAASGTTVPVINPAGAAPAPREPETGRPHVASQSGSVIEITGATSSVPPAAVEVRIQMGSQQQELAAGSNAPLPEDRTANNSSSAATRIGASANEPGASATHENKSNSRGSSDDSDSAKGDDGPGTQTASQATAPVAAQHVANAFAGTHGAAPSTVAAVSTSSATASTSSAAAASINTPAQTPTHTLPAKAEAPAASTPSQAQELAESGKAQQQPLRSMSLEFSADGAQDVRVRLQERGGDVHISLHSNDAALSGRLRDGVDDLAGALSNAGYNADAWASGGGRQQQQQRDPEEQRQPQRRNDQNAAGKDFSGMMQQNSQEAS
jgi:trimeric autotransporter adhesin